MKKTNSSDVDFVETTVQNLSHFPQYITVFITRVTGLPLFTERELVFRIIRIIHTVPCVAGKYGKFNAFEGKST